MQSYDFKSETQLTTTHPTWSRTNALSRSSSPHALHVVARIHCKLHSCVDFIKSYLAATGANNMLVPYLERVYFIVLFV